MTATRLAVLTAFLVAAAPAAAQYAPRSLSLEGGLAAGLLGAGAARAPVALGATFWLDGDVDACFRVSFAAAPRTSGRAADDRVAGTAGLRWSLAPAPLRPQLSAELGWSGGAGVPARLALGATAGVEGFLAPDLSLALRAAVRRGQAGEGWTVEAALAAAVYF